MAYKPGPGAEDVDDWDPLRTLPACLSPAAVAFDVPNRTRLANSLFFSGVLVSMAAAGRDKRRASSLVG